jgi:predicted nucleotidyltransferase
MSSYRISFEQIQQDPKLKDMLQALERGLKKFNIDYYLVGAVSRDVWMRGINKIPPGRTTGDIDFAIFINDKGIYEQLIVHTGVLFIYNPANKNNQLFSWKNYQKLPSFRFSESA